MTPRFTTVLFDLDGTLIDSAPGILTSLAHTHREMGREVPPTSELMRWIGPPILDSFRDFAGFDEADSARALTVYRAHYRAAGMLDSPLFPGVIGVVRAVQDAGLPRSIATSKPESAARAILAHHGVDALFTEISGASDDERISSKADVVAQAIERLTRAGADLSRTVLVGDRIHDVEGAAVHGIPTIAVDWGYGDRTETSDAIAHVATPAELLEALGLSPV